jgi:hypothetical protein
MTTVSRTIEDGQFTVRVRFAFASPEGSGTLGRIHLGIEGLPFVHAIRRDEIVEMDAAGLLSAAAAREVAHALLDAAEAADAAAEELPPIA